MRPHRLQHIRLPCPLLSPRVCSNSCPLSQWCHPTISFSVTPSLPALNVSRVSVFSDELAFHIRWPKYWSFSISPSNEYLGLISFRMDWFGLLAVQGTLNSFLQHHSSKASVLRHSAFLCVFIHFPWKRKDYGRMIADTLKEKRSLGNIIIPDFIPPSKQVQIKTDFWKLAA